ncbi:MFS transporter [Acuticoccus sediminis]|uniref:MFS transporter n=1 Tax=Acuticoccus sediminis TaxID=2184697 RepID=UPI001CFE70C6|nr:MFS transporter [Acuticoccus sediminis]
MTLETPRLSSGARWMPGGSPGASARPESSPPGETPAAAPQGVADDPQRAVYRRVFLPLWGAAVGLQAGFLVHDVSAAWVITAAGGAASLVALAQTAATAPFFLLALPGGTLADLYGRARIIMIVAAVLSVVSATLAGVAAAGFAGPMLVLAVSLANGCGNALTTPAWQAMTPELIRGERLPGALALNSLGINIARSIGPVTAGFVLAWAGPPAAFALNAAFFAAVAATFGAVGLRASARPAASEGFWRALAGGARYVASERPLQVVALKATTFFFFAASFWALAPVVVAERLDGNGGMLGLMVGSAGVGAVTGWRILGALRRRLDLDGLMRLAGLVAAAALCLVPFAGHAAVFAGLQAALGFAWLIAFSSIHLAAQLRLPTWVRGRGTALYLIAIFGSMATGSALAGLVTDAAGLTVAYLVAGVGLLVATLVARRLKIAVTTASPTNAAPAEQKRDGDR